MHITHLSLTNFRNYSRLEIDLPSRFVVFEGQNAQGKTNLLEAVFYLATTRSPRSSSDKEMVNWLAQKESMPFAKVAGKVQRSKSHIDVDITVMAKQEESSLGNGSSVGMAKRIRVNGLPKRAIDLVGQVNVVMFGPQDIELVSGSPQTRRRYLDIMNSQIDSQYLRALQQYSRVLVQRNHLLRQIRDRHAHRDQLAFWDEQMVESGSYIVGRRRDTVEALNDLVRDLHPRLTGRQEHLKISYITNVEASNGEDEVSLRSLWQGAPDSELRMLRETPASTEGLAPNIVNMCQSFRDRMSALLEREIALGMSVVGPHRDDLQLSVDGIDLNVYGSRGQQRTAALSLKLAEAKLMESETGERPILLLDDIMSELDAQRRSFLLETINDVDQVLVTTTDLDRYSATFLFGAGVFKVTRGQVERITG